MPSARQTYRTVAVEPQDVRTSYNMAPSSRSPSPRVHFASRGDPVASISRPLEKSEAWSLYHFENHARGCLRCSTIRNGSRLCAEGRGLAADVQEHVTYRNGNVYSTHREGEREVRVEVPRSYGSLYELLKLTERRRLPARPVLIDQDFSPRTVYANMAAPAVRTPSPEFHHRPAVIETFRTDRPSRRNSMIAPPTYRTVTVDGGIESRPRAPTGNHNRGSMYVDQPTLPTYRIEVREPSSDRRRHRRHRD